MATAVLPPLNELDNPTVDLMVQGHAIPIRMDLNAMALYLQLTGINLLTNEGLDSMQMGTITPANLKTAAWCCIAAVDSNLTAYPALESKDEGPRIVGGWFGVTNWFELVKGITLALKIATDDDDPPEAETEGEGDAAKNEEAPPSPS